MQIIKHQNNVHELKLVGKHVEIAHLSDLHWDNPKTDRRLLKKTFDYCLKNGIPVFVNGDFFCLMQGRGDRRSNKSDIRPEHNNAKYLDSIVDTAVEWFAPYKDIIAMIGYGNHETAIIKWQETDILERFVDKFNRTHSANVQIGGYGGWIIYNISYSGSNILNLKHRYFHGSGGGGIVTKGTINLTRATEMYDGFDIFSMGHVHENLALDVCMNSVGFHSKKGYYTFNKNVHMMITGTFKEEYGDGSKGWHVERGAPPKPIGGRILTIDVDRQTDSNGERLQKHVIDSRKFPFS